MWNKFKNKTYHLLRWSEKYTKTDMVYLTKGGFWLTTGKIISAIVGFILLIIYANFLPKETFGNFQYILSIIGLLYIFNLPGLDTSLTKSITQGFEGSTIDVLKTKIKWSSIAGIICLGIGIYYFSQDNYSLGLPLLICGLFIPFLDSFTVYNSVLIGKKEFKTLTSYRLITQIISFLAICITVILSNSLVILISVYLLSNTILRIFFFKLTLKNTKPNTTKDTKTISYGKHLSAIDALGLISLNIDKLLLWYFLGAAQLAIYVLVLSPIMHIKNQLNTLQTLAFPKMANQDIAVIKKTLPQKMIKFFIILVPIVILYVILAPFIYKLLFPQYLEAIKYSQWYMLTVLLYPQKLISLTLKAHQKTKALYKISIISSLARIVLLVILLPMFGIMGAIIALAAPLLLNTVMLAYFFKKI